MGVGELEVIGILRLFGLEGEGAVLTGFGADVTQADSNAGDGRLGDGSEFVGDEGINIRSVNSQQFEEVG